MEIIIKNMIEEIEDLKEWLNEKYSVGGTHFEYDYLDNIPENEKEKYQAGWSNEYFHCFIYESYKNHRMIAIKTDSSKYLETLIMEYRVKLSRAIDEIIYKIPSNKK